MKTKAAPIPKKPATRKPQKPWTQMTADELQEETKEFDKPLPPGSTRPLNAEEREQFERSREGPSISVHVRDDQVELIRISLEGNELARVKECASKRNLPLTTYLEKCLHDSLPPVA